MSTHQGKLHSELKLMLIHRCTLHTLTLFKCLFINVYYMLGLSVNVRSSMYITYFDLM